MSHITYTERLIIEKLYNSGSTLSAIARYLNRAVSSIHAEVHRGLYDRLNGATWLYERKYSADIAQADADFKASAKGSDIKLGHNYAYAEEISKKIHSGLSPDAIVGEKRRKGEWTVCTTTLYSYIENGYIPNVTIKNLVVKSKEKKKKRHVTASKAPAGRSIEKRPEHITSRTLFGDWEMDTVVGKAKGKNQILLVLTERKTRYELIHKLPNKTAVSVVKALRKIIKIHGYIFNSLAVDNGTEFSDAEGMEKLLNCPVYYCHPYSSYERGSNENANRLIRRFLPKGTSFKDVTQADCDKIAAWINNYPRRILGYQTAEALFQEELNNFSKKFSVSS